MAPPPPPFTSDEIAAIATRHQCDVDGLLRRWIVQAGRSYYVMGPDGEYLSPITRGELAVALPRDLMRVPDSSSSPAGIDWFRTKGTDLVPRSVDDLVYNYASNARHVVADMSLQRSTFDNSVKESVFYEAVCPRAEIEPREHPQIARWLELLGGDKTDKLLDWIATITDLSRPSCALLVTGRPGAGKEMLAQGLARLWRRARAPTELARVLGDFNEDLTRCPLVFCDESLPAVRGGRKGALADLKSMIAASTRTLARKFLSNANLVGAIRLVLAANDNKMLESLEEQSGDSQDATAERFLHIRATSLPVDYLKEIGGRSATEQWVSGKQIAEHAAWLQATRHVVPSDRYVVSGDAQDLQRQLVVSNRQTSLILEWLVRFIVADAQSTAQILVGNHEVLVNATTICSSWNQYIRSDFVPSTTLVGTALSNLSLGEKRVLWPSPKGPHRDVRYHSVKVDYLLEWSKQNLVGDLAAIAQRVAAPLDVEEMKKKAGSNGANGSNGAVSHAHALVPPIPPEATGGTPGVSLFDKIPPSH